MKAKTKIALAIFIAIIIILAGYFFWKGVKKPFVLSYESERAPLIGSLLVNVDDDSLLPACACFAPVTNDGRGYYIPGFFALEGQKLPEHLTKEYAPESLIISSFGTNPSDASIGIAEEYWDRIELVVLVSNYEQALQAAPLAAWLNAPLIFKGAGVQSFLDRRAVRSAIVVGAGDYNVGMKRLNSRAEIWNFYLDRLEEKGYSCNYVIVTNHKDLEEDVMVQGLSLSSAVLGAFRRALIITGDYTVEKDLIFKLGYGCGEAGSGERGEDPDTLSDGEEMEIQRAINQEAIKIDNEIDHAIEFLENREMTAEYLAPVGSPDAVPMLYIKNPIWYEDANNGMENDGEEYLATDSYYGDLDIKLDLGKNEVGDYICYNPDLENAVGNYNGSNYEYANPDLYTQELAVGRIVASNLLDGSALIARSLSYEEESLTHSILTSRACGDASQNCAEHQRIVFARNWVFSAKPAITGLKGYWSPHEISVSHSAGNPAAMSNANLIIYNGHGFPDGWYYWWVHAHDYENTADTIRTEDILALTMAPSVIFSASCLCSALDWPVIWNGSTDERRYEELGMDMFFSLALLRTGALAHIGSTEESWGAFILGEVEGYGDFELATIYFEELLDNDLTLGKAHSSARERYYSQYNSAFDKTCFLENVLYGEPAVNP